MQPRLIKFEPLYNMKLRLKNETGEIKLFDVSSYAIGSRYGELLDESSFRTVHLLPGGTGIEWSNGQAIVLHELYDDSIAQRLFGAGFPSPSFT